MQGSRSFPGGFPFKGLEVFVYSPGESLPVLQSVGSKLEAVWNMTEMSCQLNLE